MGRRSQKRREIIIDNSDDYIRDQLFQNSLSVHPSIIPIFSNQDGSVRFLASSVYIEIQEKYFLITAAHVPAQNSKLLILDRDGKMGSVPSEEGFKGYQDWADIAVSQLKRELIGYTPLKRAQIGNYLKMDKGTPLIAIGFPGSQTRVFSNTIDSKLVSCVTQEVDEKGYLELDAKNDRHIVIHFDKENMTDATGKKAEAPKPIGMSGGGVFWVHKRGKFESTPLMLVAVMTRWGATKKRNIVATQLGIVDLLLRQRYNVELFG